LRPNTQDLYSLGVQGEASRTRDEYNASRNTGALFRQWTGQVRRLQGGPGAACQRNGHDIINAMGAHRLSEGWTGDVSFSQKMRRPRSPEPLRHAPPAGLRHGQ
jgi:hypothetical protein